MAQLNLLSLAQSALVADLMDLGVTDKEETERNNGRGEGDFSFHYSQIAFESTDVSFS